MWWWGVVAVLHLCLQPWVPRPVKAAPRGKRTIIGRYPVCPRGCTSCSPVNGCVTCESRYFMFLYRQDMRQIGLCTPSCPLGYYGVRHQFYSTCNRCQTEHCQACFSRHYCTRCERPLVAYQGQCVEECPEGLYFANFSRDCRQRVDCILGPWSEWSSCTRNGQTCGYKWGRQSRTRHTLQTPSPNGQPCPSPSRSRRCRLANRWCSDEDCTRHKRHRNRLRKHKRKRGRKRKRGKKKKQKQKKNRRRHQTKKNKRTNQDRGEKGQAKRKPKTRQRRFCRSRNCRSRNRHRHDSDCQSVRQEEEAP
ncbi:R-spondin-2-like [Babylonia areolata]|uniref:R-spondin-2-like n=1 Tax=Babylonia areolata TaxID=304850 RepID=UPI003FD18CAA